MEKGEQSALVGQKLGDWLAEVNLSGPRHHVWLCANLSSFSLVGTFKSGGCCPLNGGQWYAAMTMVEVKSWSKGVFRVSWALCEWEI
jgi:hypothetical protein